MASTFNVPGDVRKALGKKVWWPESIPKRGRLDGRPRPNVLFLFVFLTLSTVAASLALFDAVVIGDNTGGIWGFLFIVGATAYCLRTMRPRVRMPVLAVHEHGVLVPQTVTTVPGMNRLGGPAVLMRSEIRGATRVADGETLAVLIQTGSGQTGLVDNAQRDQGLSNQQWQAIVDPFCAALVQIGIPVKRGSMSDVRPDVPAEDE